MPDSDHEHDFGSIRVDRLMLHELFNHLTIALGHCDLLLLELAPDAPPRSSLAEIRGACQRAVNLVEGWHHRDEPPE